nr:hypothetical protein [Bacillota bacterium]
SFGDKDELISILHKLREDGVDAGSWASDSMILKSLTYRKTDSSLRGKPFVRSPVSGRNGNWTPIYTFVKRAASKAG